MKTALVSGANGTVGRALQRELAARGVTALPYTWSANVDHPEAISRVLDAARADAVFHLAVASSPRGLDNEGWRINVEWPARLAEACAARQLPLIFTSTAMVFSDAARGPFTIDSPPDAAHGYGCEKRVAEERVLGAHPTAMVVRLGWQIADLPEAADPSGGAVAARTHGNELFAGNQMMAFLEQKMRSDGVVRASRRWLPACSFLADTTRGLADLAERALADQRPPDQSRAAAPILAGRFHFDSNAEQGASFFEIVQELNRRLGERWRIEADDSFVFDQRLIESRRPLAQRCFT
ncbi:MAG: sugar nucleotide-binding protein [Phycisphaerae bacterium]|nr:sugar nucleotide-binding protein [Phycisphaerae bacterium]